MRKAAYFAALAVIAFASAVLTAMLVSPKQGVAGAAEPAATKLFAAPLFRIGLERPTSGPKPLRPRRPAAIQPLAPPSQRPRTTASLYERTIAPAILHEQGCRAAHARTSGLVILDFGKLASRRGDYGTILFSNGFASNTSITWALKSYARGYATCLPRRSTARIILVRGTSNFRPTVPSTYTAGRLWARETVALADWLRVHHFDGHVQAAAGDDAEPAWDRTFRRTYDFFRGYRAAARGYLLYNFGSLDGGVGAIWNARQAFFVDDGVADLDAHPLGQMDPHADVPSGMTTRR